LNFGENGYQLMLTAVESGETQQVYQSDLFFNFAWLPDGEHLLLFGEADDRATYLFSIDDQSLERLVDPVIDGRTYSIRGVTW